MPFRLQAAATGPDAALTNVTILLDGSPVAGAGGSPVVTTAELEFPARYAFTARAQDNQGGTTWATQEVAVVSWPLHWLLPGGLRSNGAFKLCMFGEAGCGYQVLASDDLRSTNWVAVGVMEATNGVWRLLDSDATNHAWRFYRAVQLP